jgi:hypothetical protein
MIPRLLRAVWRLLEVDMAFESILKSRTEVGGDM